MSSCGCFDCTSAPLCLIVSPVMRFGLHLDVELVLVCAGGDRPFQGRERGHGDATEQEEHREG